VFTAQLSALRYLSTYRLTYVNMYIPINTREYFRLIDFWGTQCIEMTNWERTLVQISETPNYRNEVKRKVVPVLN
jgi:hypothetical protein